MSKKSDGLTAICKQATRAISSGRPADAISSLTSALSRFRGEASILRILARAYEQDGQRIKSLETYNRIFEIGRFDSEDLRNAGRLLSDAREQAQALGILRESNKLQSAAETTYEIARASFALGDLETAFQSFRQVADENDSLVAWTSLATIVPGVPSATNHTVMEVRCAFADRLHRECDSRMKPRPRPPLVRHSRLRVGYLSSFFNRPNYMKPVWGLINHHNRDRFEAHLFSDAPSAKGMEGYIPCEGDCVHDTSRLSCDELADRIRDSEIDVLIDLNGYSDHARLELFLQPVAPVTAAWFNMYGTSGLPGIDVIIGDREVVTPEEESEFTERVHCLPVSYLTFDVDHRAPPIASPPCERNGFVTFGSLVAQYKITHVTLDAWAEMLRRAPRSRLVLGNRSYQSSCNRDYVQAEFRKRGIAAERLTLLGPAEHYEYLKYYDEFDVALDAFPYNGGTTTMEALWQGVPVLTFHGDRWASRTSQTLLNRTHLEDFVAPDGQGYVNVAVSLAQDPQTPTRLATLRSKMRPELRASTACDTERLAREMEELYVSLLSVRD